MVVVGEDAAAAALFALVLARAEADRRRVAVADLVGDLAPLRALLADPDGPGLSDSFEYGVSFTRIAQPVGDDARVFVLPSGSEPVATEAIYANERWARLTEASRDRGGLLVLVAAAGTPGLDALIAASRGVIVVGDATVPPSHVLARIRLPMPAANGSRTTIITPRRAVSHRKRRSPMAALSIPAPPAKAWRWGVPVIVIVALLAVAAVVYFRRASARTPRPAPPAATRPAPPAETPPATLNPEDSALAAAWAIAILSANTEEGALDQLPTVGPVAAATISPGVQGNGFQWYRVVAGALVARSAADSLAGVLRGQGLPVDATDAIVRVPYALLLAWNVPPDSAAAATAHFLAQGIPAYALQQEDGTTRLLAGAFATPEDAMLLAPRVREAGIEPAIVFRTGSTP